MTVTVLKISFKKLEPNIITYRNYKSFCNDSFREVFVSEIQKSGSNIKTIPMNKCIDICNETLNRFAPLKTKYVRANNKSFMNKEISKAIMTRTRLRNKYFKIKTIESKTAYNKQRNLCLSLIRSSKRKFYNDLDHRKVTDNKLFWRVIGPCFSEKGSTSSKITLEEDETVQDNEKIANIFNDYFSNVVSSLSIPEYVDLSVDLDIFEDPFLKSIEKFKNHQSIISIKNRIWNKGFSFQAISKTDIENEILDMDNSKASQEYDVPTKIIKMNSEIFSEVLHNECNKSLKLCKFPESMKVADVTPVYKKGNRFKKENYRPVSILPNLSKVFERCLNKQLSQFFLNIFSKFQCGFRKGHSAQHSLIALLENWRASVDGGLVFGALLTDLSKAFDCLPHDLLVAKLYAYGLDINSARFIFDYLTNRKQRVKIMNKFSSWENIAFGVPQGSILGPFLFNVYMCDMFYKMDKFDIASYADDTTPYVSGCNVNTVITSLENASSNLFEWFKDNQMQGNANKCHVLLSTDSKHLVNINGQLIENSNCEKLLGVDIDSNLKFKSHVKSICGKARAKLSALTRIAPFLGVEKRKLIMNAFFKSQFSYCPLVWMIHNRTLNNKINRLHEKCLRIVYSDEFSSYENLLKLDGSFSVHKRNLQILAIELYKRINGISPEIMKDVFLLNPTSTYNLRKRATFYQRPIKSVHFGTESLSNLAHNIWDSIPSEIRNLDSLLKFKTAIKNWNFDDCTCRLCKVYVPQVGFI